MLNAILIIVVIASGTASQYANGVAERTIRVRQTARVAMPLPLDLPNVNGYIAVLECEHIGEVWQLRFNGGNVGDYLVIDCTGDEQTRRWMIDNSIILEVDHQTAVRYGFVGIGARVERVLLSLHEVR